jgi:hypothetical protein
MSTASDFDSNMASQINLTAPPKNNGGCLKPDDLKKYLNIDKFNDMMSNVGNVATEFVNTFNKEQKPVEPVDDRYKITALKKLRELKEQHKEIITKLQREKIYYDAAIEGTTNTKELLTVLKKQNEALKVLIEKQIHIIEISDRKTYYENEQNESAGWWSHHFITKYWLLIFLIIIGIIITNQVTDVKKWLIVTGLALYPLVIFFILRVIYYFFIWIKSTTTWVYLDSNI